MTWSNLSAQFELCKVKVDDKSKEMTCIWMGSATSHNQLFFWSPFLSPPPPHSDELKLADQLLLLPLQTTPKLSGLKQTLVVCYFIIFQTSMIGWMFPYIDSLVSGIQWEGQLGANDSRRATIICWGFNGSGSGNEVMRHVSQSLAGWLGLVQMVVTEN